MQEDVCGNENPDKEWFYCEEPLGHRGDHYCESVDGDGFGWNDWWPNL